MGPVQEVPQQGCVAGGDAPAAPLAAASAACAQHVTLTQVQS